MIILICQISYDKQKIVLKKIKIKQIKKQKTDKNFCGCVNFVLIISQHEYSRIIRSHRRAIHAMDT